MMSQSEVFLPPANEVCEGYVFTPVCHSIHRAGCLGPGGGWGGLALGGCLGPDPRGGWGVWPGGGVQAQARGVCRHRGCIPACTEAETPSSKRLLLRAVRILLECILVFFKSNEPNNQYTAVIPKVSNSTTSQISSHRTNRWFLLSVFLPPANEVWDKIMF